MLVDGSGKNGLAFVFDEASEQDTEDGRIAPSWPWGVRALGKTAWLQTLRIALRPHGAAPWNAKKTKEHSDELLELLHRRGIRAALVLQSPATPGVRQVHTAWNILGHSGNPYKWAGTAEKRNGLYVCPLLHPFNYEHVYGWLIERWVKQAAAIAAGLDRPYVWPPAYIEPCEKMLQEVLYMRVGARPVAVDIETNMAGTVITAIGLSDGLRSVSVPWHEYTIANGGGERERAIGSYAYGCEIEAAVRNVLSSDIPKILHNGAFDVLQLAKFGIVLNAFNFDTLLLHRVAYSQYRHGLQQACATEFCVEPWKTLHRPPKVGKSEDPWLGDPLALRAYNAKDCAATWRLCQSLAPKVGVDFSGN